MNIITTYGRVASDVTTNEVNGRTVANFRFASNNKRKGPDGKYLTNFYNVAAWGVLSDIASKYLKKGHRATISGELILRDYKGNDGADKKAVDIDATAIDLVETRNEAVAAGAETTSAPAASSEPQGFTPVEIEDLPF